MNSDVLIDNKSLRVGAQAVPLEDLAILIAQQVPEAGIASLFIAVIDDLSEIKGEPAAASLVKDLYEVTGEMTADYSDMGSTTAPHH